MASRVHEARRRGRAGPERADRDGRPHPRRHGARAGQAAGPGAGRRSSKAYTDWIKERDEAFRSGVKIAAPDPFAGYKKALDDELYDATAVLDALHVVKLGTAAIDDVRRRVQQDTLGRRGRKSDPLYGVRNILRAGRERLTDKQNARLEAAFTHQEEHVEVEVAWHAAQQLRDAYRHHPDLAEGRKIAEQVLASFPSCPIPEIASLGCTLKQWREAFLAYSSTDRSSQRRHRGRERPDRTRPRLHQLRQLPTPNAPGRRPRLDHPHLKCAEPVYLIRLLHGNSRAGPVLGGRNGVRFSPSLAFWAFLGDE